MQTPRDRSKSPGSGDSRERSRSPDREVLTVQLPANFRPGDWLCKACNAHNYQSKLTCHKCNTLPDGTQNNSLSSSSSCSSSATASSTSASSLPENFRAGDWMCPCSAHNFASKSVCHKCGTLKAVAAVAKSTPDNFRPGDWMCPCGAHNYATKSLCHKCTMAKGMATISMNLGLGGYLPQAIPPQPPTPPNFRPGDWLCSCGAHNYASKSACHKCNGPRIGVPTPMASLDPYSLSALAKLAALGGVTGNFGTLMGMGLPTSLPYSPLVAASPATPANFRPGDWLCTSCKAHNYASKLACHKCGVPRPDADPRLPPQPGKGLPANFRPGDWLCRCGAHNYSSKLACHKCNEQKAQVRIFLTWSH